ncbi:carboxylesterase [Lactarius akahatsu]|uniref:Carboxylic ester hydrolase n=1 Tax=Lactarius akahatsu TaxID=416441 RepID=A0AAD4Q9C5_9AGAM|nr:carboxylesterase [Lactarius akahatsu]
MPSIHLHDELSQTKARVVVETRFGPVTGGRSKNGAVVFLELPYALAPERFKNPVALPPEFRYRNREYIAENSYAVQPSNDGQAADMKFEDKVGLGKPTENPLFLNIVIPPSFPEKTDFAVKIYIHGGFLQFGSPHSLGSQAQYVAAERSEVWVNIGYRLSAFGFLACDKPKIEGNFGFKDQWLALDWIHENISAFGGNPENIQITGLSAGAHSVHQLLHHASRLPPGVKAPFTSAVLQSNAIATSPKTPEQLRPQFAALSRALGLDPDAVDTLSILRDPSKTRWKSITELIDSESLGAHGTFRGCLDGAWLSNSPDPMTWQRTGGLARGLLEHGVRNVIVGDLSEEWYLYSIAHPIKQKHDVQQNLERYYPTDMVQDMIKIYWSLPDDVKAEEYERLFGVILATGQVHLPVRLLHRDLLQENYPTFRYTIKWTPEQVRPKGKAMWTFRIPDLTTPQLDIVRSWLDAVDQATQELEHQHLKRRDLKEVLTLQVNKKIEWAVDVGWDDAMKIRKLLPGEV